MVTYVRGVQQLTHHFHRYFYGLISNKEDEIYVLSSKETSRNHTDTMIEPIFLLIWSIFLEIKISYLEKLQSNVTDFAPSDRHNFIPGHYRSLKIVGVHKRTRTVDMTTQNQGHLHAEQEFCLENVWWSKK